MTFLSDVLPWNKELTEVTAPLGKIPTKPL